jgi:glycosyltransferase involved in cell wall biosynthesis
MKILWLTSWYPSRVNFLSGDFVERHAKNSSLYNETFIIYVIKDPNLRGYKAQVEEIKYSGNLNALIYYYPRFKKLGKWVEIILSNVYFIFLHCKGFYVYTKRYGKPDGIMVFVALKAGIVALIWKMLYSIPFILFERWTGLLKEAKPNLYDRPIYERLIWKLIAKQSEMLAVVSEYFGNTISQFVGSKEYVVIPNAVDKNLFFPIKKETPKVFQLIHVSTLDYQKNFDAIIQAIHLVLLKGYKIKLDVYGPKSTYYIKLAERLKLNNVVTFYDEVSHSEIAKAMQACDALILYSRFETFGNVVVEANACGLPVIVSDHPVFKEIVIDGITGLFAKGENANDLAEKIICLIRNYQAFDPVIISESINNRYNSIIVGNLFHKLYKKAFRSFY